MSYVLIRRGCVASRVMGLRLSSTSAASTQSEDYFTKNKRLDRPLSPYTIYKPQMTTVLSISHRFTGLGLSVLLYAGGISALASQQTNFAQVIQSIQSSVSPSLLLALKVLAGIESIGYTQTSMSLMIPFQALLWRTTL